MIMQGPGIADIDDIDQDMFELWTSLDMLSRPILDSNPLAPPGVILMYSLNIHKIRGTYKSTLNDADNEV